jgi:transposase
MVTLLKRHEIQVLRKAGHGQTEVAGLVGVSERTVRRVQGEPRVSSVDDARARQQRRIGRPSKAEPFRQFIVDLLGNEPEILSLEILRRARLSGYPGGKTALYDLIALVRPRPVRPVVRFEGLPGEFSQHDFGHVDVSFLDASKRRVHFFASRLKYSRWVQVSLVPDERVESLVRPLVDHFAAIGGVPLLAVFDRPKTVAISWRSNGDVIEWNSTFAYVLLELGIGAEVCWPRRPQEKGSVENLVGWVKGSFFKQRRFLDNADLLGQLAAWVVNVNTKVPSRATGVTPAERMLEERKRLRPLKVTPESLALRVPVHVGPTGEVLHDTHPYSMPPEAVGIPGTLYLYRDRVRIVAGCHDVTHPRLFEPGQRSSLPEHRAAMVAAVSGKRARRYLKRQHLLQLGAPALDYLTEITHRQPREWLAEIDQLHDLLQHYGQDRLRSAFQRAVADNTFGAAYVAHYLRDHGASLAIPQLELLSR